MAAVEGYLEVGGVVEEDVGELVVVGGVYRIVELEAVFNCLV